MPVAYRKLVRDRIPEIIRADGRRPVTYVLDEAGYRQALLDKLAEEAAEATRASAADLPGELADVLEVLRALTAAVGMSWDQLLMLADDKRHHRGGFEDKIFLEAIE
jgi:predicted house-cleaning noncanonical NTP pyrophosphatase (MazG superfamily)